MNKNLPTPAGERSLTIGILLARYSNLNRVIPFFFSVFELHFMFIYLLIFSPRCFVFRFCFFYQGFVGYVNFPLLILSQCFCASSSKGDLDIKSIISALWLFTGLSTELTRFGGSDSMASQNDQFFWYTLHYFTYIYISANIRVLSFCFFLICDSADVYGDRTLLLLL